MVKRLMWPSVSEFVFATAMYESGDWESAPSLPANLIDSVTRYTSLPIAPSGVNVPLGTRAILHYPFVWLTGHLPVRLTDAERANLAEYVARGGLIVVDDHNHDIDGVFSKTAIEEITRALGPLHVLPKHHELYHCFFTFDGPPNTSHELNGWGDQLLHHELRAIMVGNRIGLLFSNKDYSSEWNFHPAAKASMQVDPTRFGVNMIVYALTR
jgi:hypothetical protein